MYVPWSVQASGMQGRLRILLLDTRGATLYTWSLRAMCLDVIPNSKSTPPPHFALFRGAAVSRDEWLSPGEGSSSKGQLVKATAVLVKGRGGWGCVRFPCSPVPLWLAWERL